MCVNTGCLNPASPKSKKGYCSDCSKIARQKWLEMIRSKSGGASAEEAQTKRDNFAAIYAEAEAAARKAFTEACPTPMVVAQHDNPLDDNSPVVKSYYVEGGVCGFGNVIVRPGTCGFARWLKKNNKGGSKSYYGGVYARFDWGLSQSYERNSAAAYAAAHVLESHGITAYADCRLD